MKVKVCGLSNSSQVETCVEYEADYCGFILNYPKSHRFISFDECKILTSIEKKKSNYLSYRSKAVSYTHLTLPTTPYV